VLLKSGDNLLVIDTFQSQITVMDFPVFKAIQPDVSCSTSSVCYILVLINEPDAFFFSAPNLVT